MLELDVKAMGEKLVSLRGNKTQEAVSSQIGISKSALAMYELGQRIPRDPIKMKLAEYYKTTVPFIFFNEKEHKT